MKNILLAQGFKPATFGLISSCLALASFLKGTCISPVAHFVPVVSQNLEDPHIKNYRNITHN